MKDRRELAKYFKKLGFKIGAEIGVAEGKYSKVICEENPGINLFCVDNWEAYEGYRDFAKKTTYEHLYKTAQETLLPLGCTLIKKMSADAAKDFENKSLDFVYIDANHAYHAVKEDIEIWSPKVRIGGVVSGHDYYLMPSGNAGVIKAVDEYITKHDFELYLTAWNPDYPEVDERQPSWYFTKTHDV